MLKKLFPTYFSFLFSFFLLLTSYFLIHPQVFGYTEKTYYIHQDNLGSVVATTDENGNLVDENSYDSFGSPNSTTDSITERGYTGQIQDSSTSLKYYNARYYDPILSRFISADQMGGVTDILM